MWIKKAASFFNDVKRERLRLLCHELLGPGVSVSISEVNCLEPDCPPVKTVILVMEKDRPTRSYLIHSRVGDIERNDVIAALSALPADSSERHTMSGPA